MLKKEELRRNHVNKVFLYDNLIDPSTEEYNRLLKDIPADTISVGRYLSGVVFMTENEEIYIEHLRGYDHAIAGSLYRVNDEVFCEINKLYIDKGFVPRTWDGFIYYTLSQHLQSPKDIELEEVTDWLEHKQYLKDIKANPNGTMQLSIDSLKPDLTDNNLTEMLEEGFTLSQAKNHSKSTKNGRDFIDLIKRNPITVKRSVPTPKYYKPSGETTGLDWYNLPGNSGTVTTVDLGDPIRPEEAIPENDVIAERVLSVEEMQANLESRHVFDQVELGIALKNLREAEINADQIHLDPEDLNPEN